MAYLEDQESLMPKAKRILFFAEAVTLAHVTRPLVLAQSLDPSRYEVHFACAEEFDFVFPKDPTFTRWTINSISSKDFIKSLASGARLYNKATLSNYINEDIALINKIKPDVIVGDFRLSLSVSASLCKIPYVALTNAHWSPYSQENYPLPDHPLSKLLGYTLVNYLFQLVRPAIFKYHALPLNQLRLKFRLKPLGDLRQVYTHGDYTLYFDVPELIPTNHLPENHRYIGPLIWSPETPLPAWFVDLNKIKPNIYVTLGSSGAAEKLPDVVSILSELDVNIIIATAGRSYIPTSKNIYVENYLPGSKVIEMCDLVICNGGSATAYQALSQGVPVLGIASNMDQHLTMSYIEKSGAGILLRPEQTSDSITIKNLVSNLISSNEYRKKAGIMSSFLKKLDCRKEFSLFLDTILKI